MTISKDDIEVYIGSDRIRCTLRVSCEKHYGLYGITCPIERQRLVWDLIDCMKEDIWRRIYGSKTGYKSSPYNGP